MDKTFFAASIDAPVISPPQFVVLMSDDNPLADGVRWMRGVVEGGSNADGSSMFMSFYSNTDHPEITNPQMGDSMLGALRGAYKAGHEIGNHTSTHFDCVEDGEIGENGAVALKRASKEDISAEIKRVEEVLTASGIPIEHQFGFRTPYLRYSDSTFRAMAEAGFLYDCSISAASSKVAGSFYWPYTLDIIPGKQELDENGNLPPDNNAKVNSWGKENPVGEHKGLWELPAINFEVHPDDFGYVEGVYRRNYGDDCGFNGYVTGFDWNMWHDAELDAEQTVRSLMHTLYRNLGGNRAPFTVGVHSQYYFTQRGNDFPKILQNKRRDSFEEFVGRASRLKDVFFVSADMVIRWMQNPVSAEEYRPEDYVRMS